MGGKGKRCGRMGNEAYSSIDLLDELGEFTGDVCGVTVQNGGVTEGSAQCTIARQKKNGHTRLRSVQGG
jgi:hypothetical protein